MLERYRDSNHGGGPVKDEALPRGRQSEGDCVDGGLKCGIDAFQFGFFCAFRANSIPVIDRVAFGHFPTQNLSSHEHVSNDETSIQATTERFKHTSRRRLRVLPRRRLPRPCHLFFLGKQRRAVNSPLQQLRPRHRRHCNCLGSDVG